MVLEIDKILFNVQRPYRYIGGEAGEIVKEWNDGDVKFCLVYPDLYEVGTSHLGLSILYHIINSQDGLIAERAFAPAPDMEKKLRENNVKLFSLETKHALKDFDIIGITIPYELTYTNILSVLDLAGIPLRASDRSYMDPLIIGGGTGAFNPEPIADFFDAIVIGDGEEIVLKISSIFKSYNGDKKRVLEELSKLKGVYVPSFPKKKVYRATVKKLEKKYFPLTSIMPYRSIHQRSVIEVARGCVSGCRFCQAGFTYRPYRERNSSDVIDLAKQTLKNSGSEEISLLSLSLGDYTHLKECVESLQNDFRDFPFQISFPSLRVEGVGEEILARKGNDRAGSFTFAPEAATERMRRIINKGNSDSDLYASVEKIFQNGWSKIKLYFMLGLPFETAEEIDGIVEVVKNCRSIGRKYHKHPSVVLSTSTFVPKSHTPFQWSRQISIDDTLERQRFLKDNLRMPGVEYRWHDARMSFIEGVFSRGGRELSKVIQNAYELGCRLDAWDEHLDFDLWMKVFEDAHVDPNGYLNQRDCDASLPWDHLFCELKKEYLLSEWGRAQKACETKRCEVGKCVVCGSCG